MDINTKYYNSVVKDVVHQLTSLGSGLQSSFHDVFIQVIQKEGTPDLTTPTGRTTAFVQNVEANTDAGTPGGKRIQAYVKTQAEYETNAVTEKKKRGRRNNNLVIFNVFDSGSTRGSFKELMGAIEKNELELIGGGLHELTAYGEYGKCVSPTYPEFYIYRNGTKARGKRKNPDQSWTEEMDRTARSRPMFVLEGELAGIKARIYREVMRMHFKDQNIPLTVDDSETTSATKTLEIAETGKGASATLETTAKEETVKTGTI